VNRFVLFAALASAALATLATQGRPAIAQPAMALGQPLPDGSMAPGTITVRVIAGTPAAAVSNADVTLTVNGQPQIAKSDGSGRATFRDVPVGATVQATIVDEQQKPQTSVTFTVPPSGGTRVMLSTKPFTGAPASHALGGPGGGPQGAPEARAMSGQPRPDRGMEPGSVQVRLTYNSLSVQNGAATDPNPPVGEPVTLVGYHSDGKVDVHTQPTDAGGHTTFSGLDVSGNTSYFVMARLARSGGVDRLMATPLIPETQAGAKVILSGEKREVAEPVDEAMSPQSTPTPAGKVRVSLEGVPVTTPVSLVDATTKTVLATATPAQGAPDPRNIEGDAPFEPAADLPPGTVQIRVHGGPAPTDAGVADVPIRIIPANQDNAEGVSAKTGPDGTVQLQAPADKPQKAVLNVNGKDLVSAPFELAKSGGRLDVAVHWDGKGRPEAIFDIPYRPELVIYAETRAQLPGSPREEVFRSRPVQLVPAAGVHLPLSVFPRVITNFSLHADIEDQLLWVRGNYTIQNFSWAPYSAGPDGMVIPLPKGFKGGQIADEQQSIASIAPGEGIRIVRPLPPGRTQLTAGFSLASEGGELEWKQDITQNLFQAGMEIRLYDGMAVTPRGAQGRVAKSRDGTQWFVLDDINIRAGHSMEMKITGMPSEPEWRVWLPRLVGLLVVAMLAAGVAFALTRKPAPAAPAGGQRRARLLDELVELERTGKDPARREQVLAELERLWRE
jgi:hypothetical protein